jgi:hypothetical protein
MTEIEIGDTVRFKKNERYPSTGWTGMEGVVEGFYDSGWRKLAQVRVTKEADIRPERKVGELVNDKGLSLDDLELIGKGIKVGDKVKYIANPYAFDYGRHDYRVVGFVEAGTGINHVKVEIYKNGVGTGVTHLHGKNEIALASGAAEGKEISAQDIKVGMTIRAEAVKDGMKVSREGTVKSIHGANPRCFYNEGAFRINNDSYADWTYTLVKDVPKESPNLKVIAQLPGFHVVYKTGLGHFVQTGKKRGDDWLWTHIKNGVAVEVTNKDVVEALDQGAKILKPAA